MRYTFPLVLLLIIITSCISEDSIDPNYPTTINAITETDYNQLVGQLTKTPLSACTAIDTFGFLVPIVENELCIDKEWRANFSKLELEQIAKKTIHEYGQYLGLTDSSQFQTQTISTNNKIDFQSLKTLYPDSFPHVWIVNSKQQVLNGLKVRGTTLSIVISPYGVISAGGKWYSTIYVPETDIVDEDSAKAILNRQILEYSNTKLTINNSTYWNKTEKIILPISKRGKKEFRVCWALRPENWEVLIDSQTGERISTINIDRI